MSPDDQPTIPTRPPDGSRGTAARMWQAPGVEQMQEMLPQYEIMEILGRGGMGAVYKGRQKSLKRLVAIKILPPDAADDEMKFVERFQNEAQTMAQMNHPAIVAVYDFGETKDGLLYFIMEFVDGTDVQKMIQASGRLSGEHALAITAHVCDALAYAHKRGVIHRDIKPANILINQEGHVKVADFGLAKMNDPAMTSGLTRTNMAMGTPDYVAPEVLSPGMLADHRADIYAVGVMLYQMLTGEIPRGMFKLPSQKNVGSDPRFDEIICKAMEQDREERYQTAGDVRRELDTIRATPPAREEGTGVVPVNEIAQKPVAIEPGVLEPAAASPVKKPAWPVIAGLVAVVVIAGWLVFGAQYGTTPADKATSAQPEQKVDMAGTQTVPETTVDWLKTKQWKSPWVVEKGALKSSRKDAPGQIGEIRDGVVRVRFREDVANADGAGGPLLQFGIRASAIAGEPDKRGAYQFQIFPSRRSILILYLDQNTRTHTEVPVSFGGWKVYPAGTSTTGETEVELKAEGDELSAWVNGVWVTSVRDSRVAAGLCTITASPGVEITRLETSAVLAKKQTTTAVTDPPPDISNWQDVTDSAREKARTLAGAEVGKDYFHLRENFPKQHVSLTPPGQRDIAIRVRYTGAVQVERMTPTSTFDFVLCRKSEVLFKLAKAGQPDSAHIGPSAQQPADYDPGKPHELLVTMHGPEIRAWVDGLFIGTAHDEVVQEGEISLGLHQNADIHQVEIAKLNVKRLTDEPAMDWIKKDVWRAPWSLQQGVLKATSKDTVGRLGKIGDGIIRMRVRNVDVAESVNAPPLQCMVRFGPVTGGMGEYLFQIFPQKQSYNLIYLVKLDTGAETTEMLWKEKVLPMAPAGTNAIELEIHAEGDQLSIWYGGQSIASVRDTRLQTGSCRILASPGIEITRLETLGVVDASINAGSTQAEPPPDIAHWQDITETVREKARALQDVTIEGEDMRSGSVKHMAQVPLTADGVADCAVRVRFIGQVQIDLRSGPSGFMYVLSQISQTIFQRYNRGAIASVTLGPDVVHPAGYDASKPHEILVTIEGTRIRAWLDGSFVGEAQENTLKNGATRLTFISRSVVQKVEIAELDGSSAAAVPWQPILSKPEDFGGNLKGVEFRDGATFIKGRTVLAPGDASTGAIRATLRWLDSDRTGSLTLRSTESAPFGSELFGCSAFVSANGGGVVVMMRDKATGLSELKRADFPLTPAIKAGDTFAFELRAEAGQITVKVNGQQVGVLKDSWAEGARSFGLTPSNLEFSEFRDIGFQPVNASR